MLTVKDLFENEELMKNIVEDLEDFPENTEVFYAVFALGRNSNGDYTEDEVLLGEFLDPDTAIALAERADLKMITELGYGEMDSNTTSFSIEVETVVSDPDDEDGGTMNIGTVYTRELWLDGIYPDYNY